MVDEDHAGEGDRIGSTFADAGAQAQVAIDDTRRSLPTERDGQYRRLEELGRGAQSVVRRAIDEFIGREVALKELHPRQADGTLLPEALHRRFLREARLTARLDHPGIVAVHELARRSDGTLYCAQKLVRGETLKARLERTVGLEARLGLLERLVDVCQAVGYAHARGIVHRDLKPSNIMVGEHGDTVVVDWGLAKERGEPEPMPGARSVHPDAGLTVTGLALGTPSYMSPEQARGAVSEIDERSDVYSLGVILYELMTGRLPFEGATGDQVMAAVIDGRSRRVRDLCPEAPAELAAIAERAIAHEPARRYDNGEAVAAELRAYLGGRRVAAYEYRSWELLRKFVARNRTVTAVSVGALLLLMGASVAIAWQLHQTRASLALSFVERAHAAEQGFDWARAAGYYAASRIESDTREARWGVAQARAKMIRQSSVRHGGDHELMAPGFLTDGLAVVAGLDGNAVVVRELASGRELWRTKVSNDIENLVVWNDYVRASRPNEYHYLDLATGRLVAETNIFSSDRCRAAPLSSRAWLRSRKHGGFDLVAETAGAPATLVENVRINNHCTVSTTGDRVAAFDGKTVRLFDLTTLEEIASRPAFDAQNLRFTAHGLAVVRGASLQLFGGDEGDFLVALPNRSGDGATVPADPGVSPDGHIVVVPRLASTQVDIVDLRLRAVVASLGLPPGSPRFAIAADGSRLIIGNLLDGSFLAEWNLGTILGPPASRASGTGNLRQSGSGRFLRSVFNDAFYLLDADGHPLHRFPVEPGQSNARLSPEGTRLAVYQTDSISIYDGQTYARVAKLECTGCFDFWLSGDGSRVLGYDYRTGLLGLLDAASGTVLWKVTKPDSAHGTIDLAPDGHKLLWSEEARLHLVDFDRRDQVLTFRSTPRHATFSHDSTRVAIAEDYAVGVWRADGSGPLAQVRTQESGEQRISWSNDDTALIHWTDGFGDSLLDARTGERFALGWTAKPAGRAMAVNIMPDLRSIVLWTGSTWELSTLAPPDESSPRDSLEGILAETGLELSGVELVNAIPGAR